jgi:hypothetical protein
MPGNSAALSPSPVPLTTSAETTRTQIVTAIAVDASGQPANGYREVPAGTSSELAGCDDPSPAAISVNIYSCYPSAAAANVCWPSPPASMLCMENPWDKEVRRLSFDTRRLPTVQPPTTPEPFALMLDNGTHCLFISGGARRFRNDGYIPAYACGADLKASVLGDAGGQSDPINRSKPLWTITFEQPGFQTQVRSVTTAWFAAAAPAPSITNSVPAPTAVPFPSSNGRQIPPDADRQGFVGSAGARCNYTNPAVVIGRTADSAVVICETGAGGSTTKASAYRTAYLLRLKTQCKREPASLPQITGCGTRYPPARWSSPRVRLC